MAARHPEGAHAYDREELGERLRARRAHLGLTQAEVAHRAGITQGALSNYEVGRRDVPIPFLLALARVLEVEPVALIPGLSPLSSLPAQVD